MDTEIHQRLKHALALQQQGQFAQASDIYIAILKADPNQVDALHLLGLTAFQSGNFQAADALISKAIAIQPDCAYFYSNRGNALKELQQPDAAAADYQRAIQLKPDYAEAHSNYGNLLQTLRQFDAAVACYDRAIQIKPDYAQACFNRGNALNALAQHDAAIKSFDQAIAIRPGYAEAWYNRGNALQFITQYEAAIVSFERAIALRANYPEAWANRGVALKALGLLNAAVASFDQAIALRPHYAEAWSNRGVALQTQGQLNEALASYDQAIAFKPDYAEAYSNRGFVLKELRQFDAALASCDQAIRLKPDYAEAYCNRGNTLEELQQFEAAQACHQQAIQLRPDFAQAWSNQGNTLQKLRQFDAALASYERALTLKPDYGQAWSNRSIALMALNRLDAALESCDRALALMPDCAEAHTNRGNILQKRMQLDAAISSYDRAIQLKPDDAETWFNKSLAVLLSGDFENGWQLYEWRWIKTSFAAPPRNFSQPLWLGKEPLEGKTILLHSEQGLGDTIQFCRYTTLVAAQGARVILEAPASLIALLGSLTGVAEWVEQGKPLPAFDYHCPLLSLPLAFKTRMDSIPAPARYLHADADKQEYWKLRLGKKTRPRIGLSWSGNRLNLNNHNRSLPLALLMQFLPADFQYVCLQKEVPERDRAALQSQTNMLYLGGELNDFADTAALCELMDLVITVDTSVAHLSGATGTPTWVLLCFAPDWRWLTDRGDSPWYPSVKLYRQTRTDDWSPVLSRLSDDLTLQALHN